MSTLAERKAWVEDFVLQTDTRSMITNQNQSRQRVTAIPPLPPKPSLPDHALTKEQEEVAIQRGHDEHQRIRQAFVDFQYAVKHTSLYMTMLPQLEQFAENMQVISNVLDDDIDYDQLSSVGRDKYASFQQFRADVLRRLYYHNQGDDFYGHHS